MPLRPAYSYRQDPAVPDFPDDKPIIVFDGYCALCSGWASFVLRHDTRKHYRLLAAQSPLGVALYAHYGLKSSGDYDSNILIADGMGWIKSEGSIRMAEGLGFPWRLAGAFRLLPLGMRDAFYGVVARNRLKWFGRRDSCYLPPAEFRDRFLA